VSARLAARPLVGLVVGASAARGAWLSRDLARSRSERPYAQRAFGADAEYSRDHWLVRGELVWTAWDLPFITDGSVSARGSWIEGRYRLSPRFYVAARADRLDFSRIIGQTVAPGIPTPWDAPVRRLEAAVGWYLQRNLVARLGVQRNARDGGRVHERTFVAGQLTYWF
jgi:hypothetical protein